MSDSPRAPSTPPPKRQPVARAQMAPPTPPVAPVIVPPPPPPPRADLPRTAEASNEVRPRWPIPPTGWQNNPYRSIAVPTAQPIDRFLKTDDSVAGNVLGDQNVRRADHLDLETDYLMIGLGLMVGLMLIGFGTVSPWLIVSALFYGVGGGYVLWRFGLTLHFVFQIFHLLFVGFSIAAGASEMAWTEGDPAGVIVSVFLIPIQLFFTYPLLRYRWMLPQ